MKKLIIASLGLLLLSCGGDSETVEDENIETTVTDEVNDEVNEEVSSGYVMIEDYGTIKTRTDLITIFGEENLSHGESWYAEGTVKFNHTVLKNPENGHLIKYLWKAEDPDRLNFVEANYYIFNDDFEITGTQSIGCECGISTGMSLEKLKAWNEAEINFSGFGWDYEGGIFAQDGSKIDVCRIQVKLSFDLENETPEKYRFMYSDQMFSTIDEKTDGAPVLIDVLTYNNPD